jgi:hypothetical protein
MKQKRKRRVNQLHPIIASARQAWRHSYKKKDVNCCDFDTFFRLSQLPCHYCGREPFKVYNVGNSQCAYNTKYQRKNGDFVYNGIDRIDNTKPHYVANLVTCCWICNRAKANMTTQEFVEWISLVFQHSVATVL